MDIIKNILAIIKKNIVFLSILLILATAGGLTHFFTQSLKYVSNFKTNNGSVDYPLFKSLTDFKQISSDTYNLSEEEIATMVQDFSTFKVSFVEETTTSISFTLVSNEENADHNLIQDNILRLINHNKFVKNSQLESINLLKKELSFLKGKIAELDSMLINPSSNVSIERIPSDSYELYSEQLKIEEKINSIGKFEIIKPITEIKVNKRPVVLFIALYFILAGFIFLVFASKIEKENIK